MIFPPPTSPGILPWISNLCIKEGQDVVSLIWNGFVHSPLWLKKTKVSFVDHIPTRKSSPTANAWIRLFSPCDALIMDMVGGSLIAIAVYGTPHKRKTSRYPAVAKKVPSGLKPTLVAPGISNTANCSPVCVSHNRTVPS